MDARVRLSSCLAVALVLLFITPAWSQGPAAAQGPQAAPAVDLDRALRANDLGRARDLVPLNWAASEQLFVSYLEGAFVTPGPTGGAPEARALAFLLADVFFKIIEFDFARSVVLTLDASDAAMRQQLVTVVRNYYTTLERVRVATTSAPPVAPQGMDRYLANSEQYVVGRQMAAIADRFGALSFPRGQFWALTSMINVGWPPDSVRLTTVRRKIEDQLGDDLIRVGKRPLTEATLALAEELGLPKRRAAILEELSQPVAQSSEPAQLKAAAGYLERALALYRGIPVTEDVHYWMFRRQAPRVSTSTLPALWSVYLRLGRPADAAPLMAEALAISAPFGEAAQAATLRAFGVAAALKGDAAVAAVVAASRQLGPSAEVALKTAVATVLATDGGGFHLETAETALALAVSLPDPHERAVTLEWYARRRERAREIALFNPGERGYPGLFDVLANAPYPAAFERLLETCLDAGDAELVASALGYQAEAQAYAGETARSVVTFRRALDLADGASRFERTALIAIRAIQGKLPAAARAEFASRAIEAAEKANLPLVIAEALRIRASVAAPRGAQRLENLQQALAAAEKSDDPRELVLCLQATANELVARGDYRPALDMLERAAAKGAGLAAQPRSWRSTSRWRPSTPAT